MLKSNLGDEIVAPRSTGTKPIEKAAADLDYVVSLPSAESTGRVYGSIVDEAKEGLRLSIRP